MVIGPPWGYFSEPTKSILFMSPRNILWEEAFFRGYGLKVVMGSWYLGGFVGTEVAQAHWLDKKVERWRSSADIMSGVVCNHPQTAYAVLQNSLHLDWDFVQRVTPNKGAEFQPVEDALQKAFLLSLLKGDTSQITGITVTGLTVKQYRITLPDPNHTARANWTASCVITGHLVVVLCGTAEFRSGYHALLMGEVRD